LGFGIGNNIKTFLGIGIPSSVVGHEDALKKVDSSYYNVGVRCHSRTSLEISVSNPISNLATIIIFHFQLSF